MGIAPHLHVESSLRREISSILKKQQHLSWLLGGNEMFANKIQVNILDFKSLEN